MSSHIRNRSLGTTSLEQHLNQYEPVTCGSCQASTRRDLSHDRHQTIDSRGANRIHVPGHGRKMSQAILLSCDFWILKYPTGLSVQHEVCVCSLRLFGLKNDGSATQNSHSKGPGSVTKRNWQQRGKAWLQHFRPRSPKWNCPPVTVSWDETSGNPEGASLSFFHDFCSKCHFKQIYHQIMIWWQLEGRIRDIRVTMSHISWSLSQPLDDNYWMPDRPVPIHHRGVEDKCG